MGCGIKPLAAKWDAVVLPHTGGGPWLDASDTEALSGARISKGSGTTMVSSVGYGAMGHVA